MLTKILLFYWIFFCAFNIVNVKKSWIMWLIGSFSFCLVLQPISLLLLLYVIIIGFIFGRFGKVVAANDSTTDIAKVVLAIVFLLLPLFLFKYIPVSIFTTGKDLAFLTLLPLGISFFTLKVVSYVIDVHRGIISSETHFGRYALYIGFFPQLAAGPIDRAGNLLPQFGKEIKVNYEDMIQGWRMILWGTFMKLVIADRLATYVDQVFAHPYNFKGMAHLAATYFLSFQVYCDFAGYSLIAIGMARALGITSMKNFHFPYMAENLVDFWKRWHISLSNWLRDYVFLPLAYFLSRKIKKDCLAGVKNETWAYVGGILVTMAICGLWHGSQWTFIIWGTLHGAYLAVSHLTKKIRKRALRKCGLTKKSGFLRIVRIVITFNLVSFAWIFFRANNLPDAWHMVRQIFAGLAFETQQRFFAGISLEDFLIPLIFVGLLVVFEYLRNFNIMPAMERWGRNLRWAAYYVLLLAIFMFGLSQGKTFIYSSF